VLVLNMVAFIDTAGKRFGRLVVIEDNPDGSANPRIKCKCDCGKITNPVKHKVRVGRTTSCGCKRERKDLIGTIFGSVKVIGNGLSDYVRCRCSCGTVFDTNRKDINSVVTCGGHGTRTGTIIPVHGINLNMKEWGILLGISRERARQLNNKGRLVERIKKFIGSPRAKTK